MSQQAEHLPGHEEEMWLVSLDSTKRFISFFSLQLKPPPQKIKLHTDDDSTGWIMSSMPLWALHLFAQTEIMCRNPPIAGWHSESKNRLKEKRSEFNGGKLEWEAVWDQAQEFIPAPLSFTFFTFHYINRAVPHGPQSAVRCILALNYWDIFGRAAAF